MRHDLPQPRQLFARRDACRPGSEVVDGRDHLAGGHVAHRALHRMAVVIEADREQFVLSAAAMIDTAPADSVSRSD